MQRAGEQFRSKREQFTTQIRRLNRQDILTKRRNILVEPQQQKKQISMENTMSNTIQNQIQPVKALQQNTQQLNTKSKYHVIDQRFKNKIFEFQAVDVYKVPFMNFVQAIHDPDILRQHYGIIGIKKILTISKKPPIQQVIDAGLIPRLIQYAKQTDYPQLQLEAVWCLTNVASGNNSQTGPIIEKGGIKIFVDLLLSVHVGIVQQAIWVLGNIARDSSNYRDKIIKEGGLKNLIKLIQFALTQLQKNEGVRQIIQSATWTLAGICQTPPNPPYQSIKQVLSVFYYIVKNDLIQDQEILGNVCNAISAYVNNSRQSNKKIDKIQVCINSGVVPKIVEHLDHSYDNLVIACLKIVGNIASGSTEQSKYLITLYILPKLQKILQKAKKIMRREACWVLSNLTAGSMFQIQAIFSRQQLVSKLIKMLRQDQNTVKSQIFYLFANSTDNGEPTEIFKFLASIDYIPILVQNLHSDDKDLIFSALQCLEIVLQFQRKNNKGKSIYVAQLHKLKAVQLLQDLQYHDDDKIYDLVSRIIQKYFELEDPLHI